MSQRLDYIKASPEGFKAMMGVEGHVKGSVEKQLLHLVKLRASQINGCAFCIDMHWREARADGEGEQRLYSLDAWREAPLYSEKERAALGWTEALTSIASTHAPDEAFAAARAQFSDKELTDLSWAVAAINAWNRIAIGFRVAPKAV
ncbi:MAG TPA: carboxymuconolactone decarboxylase family protein [Phycisphaerales bacterium]|nr:carboxymuconolactone decarboxylase family protein [Phycisphaerales bacterium]